MKPCIAVIGTVFTDYKGFSGPDYRATGRNIGHVETVAGGVARNVAMNLAHLDMDTWLVGTLSTDIGSQHLIEALRAKQVHLDYLKTVSEGGTGIWLAILNHEGTLLGSISQMPDIQVIEQHIVPALPRVLSHTTGIALEVDLSTHLIEQVIQQANQTGCKIYALPGNLSVIRRHPEFFHYMECFICNDTEAEVLMDIQHTEDIESMMSQMQQFNQQYHLNNLVITMGSKGAVYADRDGCCGYQPVIPATVVDSTGAGDAFFSGTVAALSHQKTLPQAVEIGAQIASIVISARQSDCSKESITMDSDGNLSKLVV